MTDLPEATRHTQHEHGSARLRSNAQARDRFAVTIGHTLRCSPLDSLAVSALSAPVPVQRGQSVTTAERVA